MIGFRPSVLLKKRLLHRFFPKNFEKVSKHFLYRNTSWQIEATQPARSILGIFVVYSLSVAMFRTSREHLANILKEKIFLKVLNGKVVFVLKVYDLIIKNINILANSSNHEVMFPKYSRNIPRMSVSKIFQGYPRNIVKLWKYF